MIRPRLCLAMFALLTLGLVTGAQAADLGGALLAQSAGMQRGSGFYLSTLKFVPVLAIFLLWAYTTAWIDRDSVKADIEQYQMWNSIAFFSGVLGFVLVLAIPVYIIGLILLLVAYFAPLFSYIGVRNGGVEEYEKKVLTSYHLGEVANRLMRKMGMKGPFNRRRKAAVAGPPVDFASPKGQKIDEELKAEAEESECYFSAKQLVFDAVIRRATDVYLEPTPEQMTVRYRIDGTMHTAEPFDRPTGDAIINILKIISAMNVEERRKPQDGTLGAKVGTGDVDFRLSTSGTKTGEKMVIRIIDKANQVTKLDQIGLRPKLVEEVRTLLAEPGGLFLVCGPAGVGKTTTLYACLREIDRFQRNVFSLEESVEMPIENVTQEDISGMTGEAFVAKIRSLIRQDADVIMIGDLRDQEPASLACQAATAGRLVLSSVEANDSVAAIFRLLDLGVEPMDLSSALLGVLSQRLVRALCDNCKEPYKPKPEFLRKANLPADKVDVFYRRPTQPQEEVCSVCGGTGYFGRTGIFELLVVTDSLRELIREDPSINSIKAEARKNGMIYLQEDGLRQVIQGRTSIEELLHVVK